MKRSPRPTKLHRAPTTVYGYHGCTVEIAKRIAEGESFLLSENTWDWLGNGVYFWEDAPFRALEWAQLKAEQTGVGPAVIETKLELGHCLNLLVMEYTVDLDLVSEIIIARAKELDLLRNTSSGGHFLDRAVVDALCARVSSIRQPFQTVRGCFPEGDPIYPSSKILKKAHVQIAVRDLSCIKTVRMVEFD